MTPIIFAGKIQGNVLFRYLQSTSLNDLKRAIPEKKNNNVVNQPIKDKKLLKDQQELVAKDNKIEPKSKKKTIIIIIYVQ